MIQIYTTKSFHTILTLPLFVHKCKQYVTASLEHRLVQPFRQQSLILFVVRVHLERSHLPYELRHPIACDRSHSFYQHLLSLSYTFHKMSLTKHFLLRNYECHSRLCPTSLQTTLPCQMSRFDFGHFFLSHELTKVRNNGRLASKQMKRYVLFVIVFVHFLHFVFLETFLLE